ncbi:VOC family protein [Kordiimonas sp.]|uniref:VOC family protein n=1 Tax=Kordiimonas sp. TaxID=1970157 RepID=UPI003A91C6DF
MNLGTFSVSLAVKNLKASRQFYEALGFAAECGSEEEKWLFMASGTTRIGLFEGMFEDNILTFNPADARAAEKALKDAGYNVDVGAKGEDGPCHVMAKDPDGNLIMFDQL